MTPEEYSTSTVGPLVRIKIGRHYWPEGGGTSGAFSWPNMVSNLDTEGDDRGTSSDKDAGLGCVNKAAELPLLISGTAMGGSGNAPTNEGPLSSLLSTAGFTVSVRGVKGVASVNLTSWMTVDLDKDASSSFGKSNPGVKTESRTSGPTLGAKVVKEEGTS